MERPAGDGRSVRGPGALRPTGQAAPQEPFMRLLLDSTVFIDVLRGLRSAVAFLNEAVEEDDELWSVTVVRTEVIAGMRPGEESTTFALLDAVRWEDVNIDLADEAGELARQYLKSHPGVDTVDFLLAAASQRLDARVCTSNVRHFPMFDGLERAYR